MKNKKSANESRRKEVDRGGRQKNEEANGKVRMVHERWQGRGRIIIRE